MKTYQETLDFLFSQLPQYQKIGGKAYKADLSNIIEICKVLGNPEKKIKTIHVAGSNGKGSVSHMLASVLQQAGYNVGLYTSPHLKDFRERIKINGKSISEEKVIDFVTEFQPKLKQIQPSFFEWTVGLAFYHFHQQKTDINVIETGLGGRLDSTNILNPEISIITNISLEHTAILGDTLELIAGEKAGIIKSNTPVVIGKTQFETESIFRRKATENNAAITFADSKASEEFTLDLKGEIQQENAQTAAVALRILSKIKGFTLSETDIEIGLAQVIANTGLLGRFQVVSDNPKVVYDTAHNPNGIELLVKELIKLEPQTLHVVIGIAQDKKQQKMLTQFPENSQFYFCTSTNERVLKGEKLHEIGSELGLKGNPFKSVNDGLETAKKIANKEDVIVVTGSNFVVAEVV